MGSWWWSSSATAGADAQGPTRQTDSSSESLNASRLQDDSSETGTPAAPAQIAKRELSRDEQAAEDLSQFIADFEAEAARERAAAARTSVNPPETQGSIASRLSSRFTSRSSPTHASSAPSDASKTDLLSSRDPTDLSFQALADEELSCRTAFDYAFFCQSMGGQWTNLYRYGELRACSHLWKEFWLCMRAKGYSEEDRRKIIKTHNIEKQKRFRKGPSSEDIWDVREKLDMDAPEPFKGDLVKLEKEVEEWKKRTGNENVSI